MRKLDLKLLEKVRKDIQIQRDTRDGLVKNLTNLNADLNFKRQEFERAQAISDQTSAKLLATEIEALQSVRADAVSNISIHDANVHIILDQLNGAIDPGDADPTLPLVLLPIRLETRYSVDGTSLKIRIYPDDIHIDQLNRGLDDSELDAGKTYWTSVWSEPTESLIEVAWKTLIKAVGLYRATYVAIALTPTNLADRSIAKIPVFPEVTGRLKRAAMVKLLPDNFTAIAFQSGQSNRKTGASVKHELPIGLFADDGSALVDVNGLKLIEGSEWLADYDIAEKSGMAITLPLLQPGKPVDQLFVVGVRRSVDSELTATDFEDLLIAQRCTQGIAFVRQGTPTNNTETDRSEWQRRSEIHRPSTDKVSLVSGSNGDILANALGISSHVIAELENATAFEQSLARSMNIALWGPSWGNFLDMANESKATGESLSSSTRESTRRFHRDFVRGRGPLPAFRMGDQPYGVLPVSSINRRWVSKAGDIFEDGLVKLLKRLREKWLQCVVNVPQVSEGEIDKTLLELLGASAVSTSLRVRSVISMEMATLGVSAGAVSKQSLDAERLIEEIIYEELELNKQSSGFPSKDSRPLALPLVDEAMDSVNIQAIMAGQSPKITSVLQSLIVLSWNRATKEVLDASAGGRLHDVVNLSDSMSATMKESILVLASRADRTEPSVFFDTAVSVTKTTALNSLAMPALQQIQPIPAYRTSFSQLALESTTTESRSVLSTLATVAWLEASGHLAELKAALTELIKAFDAGMTVNERRILVAETLDIASHRLDAWITGVIERRRQALRATKPKGMTIGAYGWVHNILPAEKRQDTGGYIAAPSLAHAATAGILRSAYLAHNPDSTGNNAFAIDLTSARVRTAMHLLQGIREGQQLGALLGYRIERAIHEAHLDRLILSLRTIAPLKQGKLTDRNQTTELSAIERLAASNVTDGIQLVEKYQGKVKNWSAEQVRKRLNDEPKDNPYVMPGSWPELTSDEWGAVSAIIEDAASAADAVADLMLAESVHQLAQGNMVRASAALDTAGTGNVPPIEPDVIATRLRGVSFTHRLVLIANGNSGWNMNQPRSLAAPMMEAWCGARLGNPATILVGQNAAGDPISLAESGLCALDIVYLSADRESFNARLRSSLPALDTNVALFDHPSVNWNVGERSIGDIYQLAVSLRTLLVNARPGTSADIAVPNYPTTRTIGLEALTELRTRLVNAIGTLSVRVQSLRSQLQTEPVVAANLLLALELLTDFGIFVPGVKGDGLVNVARMVDSMASKKIETAEKLLAEDPTQDLLITIGQTLFGDGFWTLPAIGPAVAKDTLSVASGDESTIVPTTAEIRRYLVDRSSVRAGVKRYSEVLMLSEAVGNAPNLRALQLAGAGNDIPTKWIGGKLDPAQPTTTASVCSIVIDSAENYDASGDTVALVVDEWSEVMPLREKRGNEPDAPINTQVTAGVALNANAPGARAPQAILIAVAPDEKRWTVDSLTDVLAETFEMAQLRCVTLERTNGAARVLPALYEQSWSLQGEKVLEWQLYVKSAIAAFVKDS